MHQGIKYFPHDKNEEREESIRSKEVISFKEKEFNKYLNKSKVWCLYCQNKAHYAREFPANKKNQGRSHASTIVEEETS